jgi:hypothetical protein
LHDGRFVFHTHRVGRQRLGIDRTRDGFVDRQILKRPSITSRPRLGLLAFAAMFFGRMIRIRFAVVVSRVGGFGPPLVVELLLESLDLLAQRLLIGD